MLPSFLSFLLSLVLSFFCSFFFYWLPFDVCPSICFCHLSFFLLFVYLFVLSSINLRPSVRLFVCLLICCSFFSFLFFLFLSFSSSKLKNRVTIAFRVKQFFKEKMVWTQLNNLSDHFIKRRWHYLILHWQKRRGGKNVMVAKISLGTNVVVKQMSFF